MIGDHFDGMGWEGDVRWSPESSGNGQILYFVEKLLGCTSFWEVRGMTDDYQISEVSVHAPPKAKIREATEAPAGVGFDEVPR